MSELRLMVAIARAKQRFPALRLTQIICNATNKNDPFYVTDDALTAALEAYCATGGTPPQRDRRQPKKHWSCARCRKDFSGGPLHHCIDGSVQEATTVVTR